MIGGQYGHTPPPWPFTAARSAGRKRPPAPWRQLFPLWTGHMTLGRIRRGQEAGGREEGTDGGGELERGSEADPSRKSLWERLLRLLPG